MVEMDWKTILSFNHEDITDEDKEKIYEGIIGIEALDVEISYNELKNLFMITQEVLRYRGDQVQSLTSELDEMATKQGEAEAELQMNLSKNGDSTYFKEQIEEREIVIEGNREEIDKLKQKILSLEEQIEEMLKEREDDRSSTPDPISQIDRIKELGDSLKKKNDSIKELLADIQALNEENRLIRDKLNHTREKLSEATTDIKNLSAEITNTRGENKHLNDTIEELQRSNTSLKGQMKELMEINRDQDEQLDEFSKQMDDRILDWKDILNEKNLEIEALQKLCTQLQNRPAVVKEVQPDYYTELMKKREDQIDHLQTKLREATADILESAETISKLRNEKENLLNELERARMGLHRESAEEVGVLDRMKEDVQRWRVEKEDMEECLKIKEAELAQALLVINQLEGEGGDTNGNLEERLSAASSGRKRLRQQLRVRDEHIHSLVEDNNSMRRAMDQIQLENSVMRKRLNLPAEQPISTDDILARHAARKKELAMAIKKLNQYEEQKISLQIQLRQKDKCLKKLIRQVRSCGIKIPESILAVMITDESSKQAFESESMDVDENIQIHSKLESSEPDGKPSVVTNTSSETQSKKSGYDDEQITLMKENYKQVVEENEGLRNGLHEILDAIKEKATSTKCDITSVCLEKLLRALDARHAAGWYHPAMRTLLELQAEKGVQNSLRDMLKEARREILSTLDLLAKESSKNRELEERLSNMKTNQPSPKVSKEDTAKFAVAVVEVNERSEKTSPKSDISEIYLQADFTNVQTTNETHVVPADKEYSKMLQNILKHFHKQFESLYESMMEIFNQSSAEKSRWQIMEEQYKNNIENMSITLETLNGRLDEMEKIKAKDSEGADLSFAEVDVSKLNSIVTEKKCLERKTKYLEETLTAVRKRNDELKMELFNVKKDTFDKLKVYEIDCQKFMFHVAELKNKLRKTVPLDVFLKQNEKLNSFEIKYRQILNKESVTENRSSANVSNLNDYEAICKDFSDAKVKVLEAVCAYFNKLIDSLNVEDKDIFQTLSTSFSECKTDLIFSEQKIKYLESVNTLLSDQLDNVRVKLDDVAKLLNKANDRIHLLEEENIKVQEKELELVGKMQQSLCVDPVAVDSEIVDKLSRENEILKLENLQHSRDLDSLNNQINDIQHDKLVSNLEMNILRHQLLDLQSENDNKAIIARLSSEILVSHLHTAEMHKKRERLSLSLQREKDRVKRLEYLLHEKELQFDHYITRTNSKINFLSTALQCLREQYQGSIPLAVLENVHNTRRELAAKLNEVAKRKTSNMEKNQAGNADAAIQDNDDQSSTTVHEADAAEMMCDEASCQHGIKLKIKESKWRREKSLLKNQLASSEDDRAKLEEKVSSLEENLLMLTFAFGKSPKVNRERMSDGSLVVNELMINGGGDTLKLGRSSPTVQLMDIDAEDQINDEQKEKPTPKPRTFIRTSPRNKKSPTKKIVSSYAATADVNLPGSPMKSPEKVAMAQPHTVTVVIQTDPLELSRVENAVCQTDFTSNLQKHDESIIGDMRNIDELKSQIKKLESNLKDALDLAAERAKSVFTLESEKSILQSNLSATKQMLRESSDVKNSTIITTCDEKSDDNNELEHLKKILSSLKEMENEKNAMIEEYKSQLEKERSKHDIDNSSGQKEINELKHQIDNLEAECRSLKSLVTSQSHMDGLSSSLEQYRGRVLELEDRCFQMQRELENTHTSTLSLKSECERWKQLANDRFSDLESLSRRMEEKHGDEVKSYKMETNHWISELEQCRAELGRTRGDLNHTKSVMTRELSQREDNIRRLHYVNGNLKQQIINLQTVISASDPTFELSAISELEEEDDLSGGGLDNTRTAIVDNVQYGDTLSDITMDNVDHSDRSGPYTGRQWNEGVFDRLRREKQMLTKQNALLRKQIKVLAARERRSRLELHHTRVIKAKSPSTLSSVMKAEEISYLQRKIESLEMQLTEKSTVNYANNNTKMMQIALWDKQKKWQEAAERWKVRFEEKVQQSERLEKNLESAKQTIQRMEKDRRTSDSRMSKTSRLSDSVQSPAISDMDSMTDNRVEMLMRDKERLEEEVKTLKAKLDSGIPQGALLERIEAQQRKIVALELADRGKDVLVSEYERLLEQNSHLAKRNLKLESEILDMQLRQGIGDGRSIGEGNDHENACCRRNKLQREHLENYVKLLKEENSQLISRNIEQPVLDAAPGTGGYLKTGSVSQAKRMADLERTVLTLRGLIGTLQADNRRLLSEIAKEKKPGQVAKDKIIDELKEENAKLNKSVQEKDQLLEKARGLLSRALEKKRELQNEITLLKDKLAKNTAEKSTNK